MKKEEREKSVHSLVIVSDFLKGRMRTRERGNSKHIFMYVKNV